MVQPSSEEPVKVEKTLFQPPLLPGEKAGHFVTESIDLPSQQKGKLDFEEGEIDENQGKEFLSIGQQ